MQALLRPLGPHQSVGHYVKKLLASYPKPETPIQLQLAEPLSEREGEILHLLAKGMSNREIAQALVLTIGTVKWYVNSIYGKLSVRGRVQAVERARELGLLPRN